ncbi:putative GH25 family protein [Paucibacter oligotrophus]|uniref:Putative GH25 family protein n=1 Tax=Roseateles oligotrophus TaxID=1769250 RepID=A0A840LD86_9BURK|nr:DUF4198 domain-containing protein [Roseateles oligotrophus]MBB4844643.1 putative GH25 family protein [Roseateles oligotrophus]
MKALKISLLSLALLSLAPSAQAHRSWLLPNLGHVTGKEVWVSVDAAVSEDLFEFGNALAVDALSIQGPDGKPLSAEPRIAARHRNSFEVKLVAPGSYRFSATQDSVMASYKQGSESKRWRGSLAELAKNVPADAAELKVTQMLTRLDTFVSKDRAGQPNFSVQGQGLELQALGPVTELSDGDETRVRLLLDGKPLPEASVTLIRDGNKYRYKMGEQTLKSDAQGELTLRWAEAGRYWLGFNHSVGAAGGGSLEQPLKRYRYSATFEVLPK